MVTAFFRQSGLAAPGRQEGATRVCDGRGAHMLNPACARLYAARWALLSHEEKPASSLALSRALLLHLPLWLPRLVLGVFCALLCPHLEAREITDGNVNYSFVVTDRRTGKKLFLKQAEAFLKWQPQLALERDRMRREVQYFRDASLALALTLEGSRSRRPNPDPDPDPDPDPALALAHAAPQAQAP